MKKIFGLVAAVFMVFMISGCDLIMGKVPDEVTKTAAYPTVELACEREFSIHYGDKAELKVNASVTDGGTLTYQWYKGNTSNFDKAKAISGATNKDYTVTGNEETQAYYWCKVTNSNNLKTADSVSYDVYVKISNIIIVDRGISKAEKWDPTYTYFVTSDVWMENKLEIPAGTVVKFEEGAFLGARNNGIILAIGEAAVEDNPETEEDESKPENPVIFTSCKDNTVGISIPKYKDSTPEPGYWEGMTTENQGSKFDHCIIRYAGRDYWGALVLNAKTTVTNCTFTDNASPEDREPALNVWPKGCKSVVTDNVFYRNEWPLACHANFTVDTTNVFHFEDVTGTLKNKYQAVKIWNGEIKSSENVTWGITEVPYYASDDIDVRGTLTVAEDVIVRFAAGTNIDVYEGEGGTLTMNGLFTSYRDDAHGGDIFADGEDEADDGDWEGVWIEDQDYWNNSLNKDTTKVLFNDKSKYEE